MARVIPQGLYMPPTKNKIWNKAFLFRLDLVYSLAMECPPKAHMLKAWSPGWHYWEVFRSLEVCPLREQWDPPDPSSFSLLFPGHTQVILFHHIFPSWRAASPQTQSNRASWSQTGTYKTVCQNKPFLFSNWLSQDFVIVTESWLRQSIKAINFDNNELILKYQN